MYIINVAILISHQFTYLPVLDHIIQINQSAVLAVVAQIFQLNQSAVLPVVAESIRVHRRPCDELSHDWSEI